MFLKPEPFQITCIQQTENMKVVFRLKDFYKKSYERNIGHKKISYHNKLIFPGKTYNIDLELYNLNILEKIFIRIKKVLLLPLLVCLAFVFMSWGKAGHRIISFKSVLCFNQEMNQFWAWSDYLANHASDADNRKSSDPAEGPKHYIDIDNYPEFIATGEITHSLADAIKSHGEQFVISQGTLPWTTLMTYDSLVNCFIRHDWQKAEFFAADLGHYFADGHMPLHITRNYDGQFSGNNGIHSRYESTMVNEFDNSISYSGQPAVFIEDPEIYIFNYLYKNYTYIDSILDADNIARNLAGNTTSATYSETLWEKTKGYTIQLFANASHAFASLIYTAWVNAGRPNMESSYSKMITKKSEVLKVSYQDLLKSSIKIDYTVSDDSVINISVYDLSGNYQETLIDTIQHPGVYSIKWKPVKSGNKVYLVVLKTENNYQVKKVII